MERVLPNALPNALSNENVLGFVWNLLVKLTRRKVLSLEEGLLANQIRVGSQTYGDPILAATSLQHLNDRIAEVVESSAFNSYWQGLMAAVMSMDVGFVKAVTRPQALSDSRELLQSVLTGGALPSAEQALKYLETSAQLMPLIMESMRGLGPEVLSIPVMDLIYDQNTPTEIAEALYEGECGAAVTFALNAAVLRGEQLAPWLSLSLAERWARGLRSSLRLLSLDAKMAQEIPESVLPREQRLDPNAISERHAQVEEAFRSLNEAAERTGEPTYPSGL